ncbi:manganese efflux pump MntP [Mangrovibacterium lignilyticum]|uniref:manganese efflux pump MntP n=1 Tax=Mangrovibacterium lignilyticum TaxID=2668052 RepID=UPI0013D2FF90|nr:manganese efflux pump MntP family protein [Mangrovibacterium lignilyticum]
MYYTTIIILAMGLSVDSFAVSVTSGLSLPKIRFFEAAKLAFLLALFQAMMPVLGWLIENSIKQWIEPIDHWIAFGMLSLIGTKMILENLKEKQEKKILDPMIFKVAVVLAFATSIDAMAVGFSMALIMDRITPAVIIIGSVTFTASMLGILIGKKTGPRVSKYAEIIGGLVLITIGIKILLEHLMAS